MGRDNPIDKLSIPIANSSIFSRLIRKNYPCHLQGNTQHNVLDPETIYIILYVMVYKAILIKSSKE